MRNGNWLLVAAIAAIFSSSVQADIIWGFGSYKHPFTGADELRSKGHKVQILYVDMTENVMAKIKAASSTANGTSEEEIKAHTEKVLASLKPDMLEKVVKTDMATRLMAKKMGLEKVPAIVLFRSETDITAVYGSTDMINAAKRLGVGK